MRRAPRSRQAESQGEQGFWPSYADMMSALALILFFLMLLSYIQNLITGNDLQNTQKLLESTRLELSDTLEQVDTARGELISVKGELDSAETKLNMQQKEIAGYSATITEQTRQIASQEKLIAEQADYLSAANEEIRTMRGEMQSIAVLRLSILEQIRDSITAVMGPGANVSIGDNGNIILNEGILFDLGSAAVKPGSQKMLDQLILVFEKFLSDENNAKYVDSIVISGHTDSSGTDEVNRKLSTDRANSVLEYLLSGKNGVLKDYAQFFCAAGYGSTRPVGDNNTVEGSSANRRIEISMILRDESVLSIVEQYLAISPPEDAETANSVSAPRT